MEVLRNFARLSDPGEIGNGVAHGFLVSSFASRGQSEKLCCESKLTD
jgi:hypothetical protein